jgi:hypothetical protein
MELSEKDKERLIAERERQLKESSKYWAGASAELVDKSKDLSLFNTGEQWSGQQKQSV